MREARQVMSELASSGLSPEQLALVMELSATLTAEARPANDAGADRRREKDRERKAEVRRHPQISAESAEQKNAPTPPKKTTPIPPLKGGTFPKIEAPQPDKPSPEPKVTLKVWVDRIWTISPTRARERSSRRDTENALKAAIGRGHEPLAIIGGLSGYYETRDATKNDGEFVKGVHRMIEADRWQAFVPPPDTPAPDPWPGRAREFARNGYWNDDWGPKPGKPGSFASETQSEAA